MIAPCTRTPVGTSHTTRAYTTAAIATIGSAARPPRRVMGAESTDASSRCLDSQPWLAGRGEVVVQVRDQVAAQQYHRRVVPSVVPLQWVVGERVQLAFAAVVHATGLVDGAHP